MDKYPKVAVVYLSFHSEPYLDDMISALKKITYPRERLELVIVDNPHPEFGSSARSISETVLPLANRELPSVTLLPQETNLGFAGGINVGISWALARGFDYVFLHNDDGFMAANGLEPLIAAMEEDKSIGAAQSLILLYPEMNLVNSSGNAFHYLGLGFCNNFRMNKESVHLSKIADSGYASGAAVLLRADLLNRYGQWDEDFFLYHEDLEYCLRLKIAGFRTVTVRDSIFYHKYNFSRNREKFYYIERNRPGLLLMFYKWPTLLLILPALILWEVGMLVFAVSHGWLDAKLKVYAYWLKLSTWRRWLVKRQKIQKIRTISDRELLSAAVSKIVFDEKILASPALKFVANPLLGFYWQIIKRFIFW